MNKPPQTPLEIRKYLTEKGLSENFCPVPFSTSVFEADGKVCLCRQKGNHFSVGDITQQSFNEIWNGDKLKSIRREFLTGDIKTCASEIRRDSCNLSVDRAYLLDIIDYSEHQTKKPIRITPNFNGKCNLECPMCQVWNQPNGLYDNISFWTQLENELLPHLTEIDTFSGEPFIQKDTFKLIDMASKINSQIQWSFTTNGHWKLTASLKNYLNKINIKSFTFSIDSLDSITFSKIRKNGNLEKVLASFYDTKKYEQERIASGKSALGLNINLTLQQCNWRELPALLSFKKQNNVRISIRCLVEPEPLSLLLLPNEEKLSILNFYINSIELEHLPLISRAIRPLLESLSPFEKSIIISDLSNRMKEYTRRYNPSSPSLNE